MPEYSENNSVLWRLLAALVMGGNYQWPLISTNVWGWGLVLLATQSIARLQVRQLIFKFCANKQKQSRIVFVGTLSRQVRFKPLIWLSTQRKERLSETQLAPSPSSPAERFCCSTRKQNPKRQTSSCLHRSSIFYYFYFFPRICSLLFPPRMPGCHFPGAAWRTPSSTLAAMHLTQITTAFCKNILWRLLLLQHKAHHLPGFYTVKIHLSKTEY